MIGVLNHFGFSRNTGAYRQILNAFIFPNIFHCQPDWCHVSKGEKRTKDYILLCTAYVVFIDKVAVFGRSTYSTAGILQINILSKIQCLFTEHHLLHLEDAAVYLLLLIQCKRSTLRSTRNKDRHKFVRQRNTLTSIEYCFHYQAARLWNILPSILYHQQ